MRRLLPLASAMVFVDVLFYSAIAPLLPEYVDRLGLSEGDAGILSASYAAGTLLASLPAGLLASRFGPRRTAIIGLLALGATSVAFGFSHTILLLDATRFLQGASGALIWAGAIAWLVSVAPPERRGQVIGAALGTGVAGALFGPALGAAAGALGTEPVFSAVMVVTVVLALLAARFPEVRPTEPQRPREIVAAILSRPVLRGFVFVSVPSLMFGVVEVLVPLRIDALGGSHALIAAGFIVGAALEAGLSPLAGRYSDRVGRRLPFTVGLAVGALAMLVVGLAATLAGALAGLVATSVGAGFCFAPAMTVLSDAATATGLHQGFAAALSNMSWSVGQVIGSAGGGVLAGLSGYFLPSALTAALLVVTLVYALRSLGTAEPRGAG